MKQPGKRAQLFYGEETSYKTPPSIAATHAIRFTDAALEFDPFSRAYLPEKKNTPGRYQRVNRRAVASGSLSGFLRPSGTLNTLPEFSAAMKALFGSVRNPTLSTTVNAGATTTGGTLASGSGLAVGDILQLTCPDGKLRARFLTAINTGTGVATWAPALPSGQAPATGAAAKAGTSWVLTSANAISLWMARYLFEADFTDGHNELLKGWMIDRGSLVFPAIDEPRFTVSGPAATKTDAASHPGAQTYVGSAIPNASAGEVLIGSTAMNLLQLAYEITNGMEVRNDEIGETEGSEGYRMGDREISLSLDQCIENEYKAALYDLAMAGTYTTVFKQTGFTNGLILASYAPRVEFKVPTTDAGDGEAKFPYRAVCTESALDAGDELRFGVV